MYSVDARRELAFGVLSVTTRDWARFGLLYLNGGLSPASGEQVLSDDWIRAARTPDAAHLMPGATTLSDSPTFGYGYQWWIPAVEGSETVPSDELLALGVYGQSILVSPANDVVVAINSANPHYKDGKRPGFHENYLHMRGHAAMRAIAKHVGRR